MYVCIYVCMSMSVCLYAYGVTYLYIYTHIYIGICVFEYVCLHYAYACVCVCFLPRVMFACLFLNAVVVLRILCIPEASGWSTEGPGVKSTCRSFRALGCFGSFRFGL